MAAILNRRGVLIYEEELIKHLATKSGKQDIKESLKYGLSMYAKLKRSFTKTVKVDKGNKKFNLYKSYKLVNVERKNNRNLLIIPRFLAFVYLKKGHLKSIKNNLSLGETIELGNIIGQPLEIQEEIQSIIMDKYFNEENATLGNAGVIAEVEAGKGKTFLAAYIIQTLGLKTIYIVDNEALMYQAMDDIKSWFPDLTLGQYHAKKKTDGDIVFMIINSSLSKEFTIDKIKYTPKEYFSRFGLAVFDELHRYCGGKKHKTFECVNTRYMLGITAEAKNKEDQSHILAHINCGPVLDTEEITRDDGVQWNSEFRIIQYNGSPQYTQTLINEGTGFMQCSAMNKQIVQDPYRMQLIVSYAKELYDKNHNFFVWCDMRSVVLIIRDLLNSQGISVDCPEEDNEINAKHLMGGMSRDDIERAKNSRVIVATYQYASTGLSLPKFDAMIMVTPRKTGIYQCLKRIYRVSGDTSITRRVIDIVDNKTKLKNQLHERKKQYTKDMFNAEIITKKIDYSDIEFSEEFHENLYNMCLEYLNEESIIEP